MGRSTGSAVGRNRARRRLRAAMHEARDELRPGAFLLGAEREVMTMPFAELRATLDALLTDAGAKR